MNHQVRRQLIKLPIIAITVLIGTGNVLGMPAKVCETFDAPDSVGVKGQPGAVAIEQTAQAITHRPTKDDVDKRNTDSIHGPKRDPVIESRVVPSQFGTIVFDVTISAAGEYIVGTQDTKAGMQNAMVRFNPDGTIDAFRVVQYMGLWERTKGRWSPEFVTQLGFEVLPNGDMTIFLGGQVIFRDFDNSLATGRSSGFGQVFIRGDEKSATIIVDNIALNC